MHLKIKLLGGILPVWQDGNAGLDLHASEDCVLPASSRRLIKIGIATDCQSNFVGLIRDRSSFAYNHGIIVIERYVQTSEGRKLLWHKVKEKPNTEKKKDSKRYRAAHLDF